MGWKADSAKEQQLIKIQEERRNKGNRIKWIPWHSEGKLEQYYFSKLGKALQVTGLLMFVVPFFIFAMFFIPFLAPLVKRIPDFVFPALVAVAFLGPLVGALGSVHSAYDLQRDWVKVKAYCVDREIVKGFDFAYDRSLFFMFRLLCRFSLKGQEHTVTVDGGGFREEAKAIRYLAKTISESGECVLWVDPKNPLHAFFHEKKKIIG